MLVFIAAPPSWAGFRNRQQELLRDCLFIYYTNMIIAVSSPTNLLQILLDFMFSPFFLVEPTDLFVVCVARSRAVQVVQESHLFTD